MSECFSVPSFSFENFSSDDFNKADSKMQRAFRLYQTNSTLLEPDQEDENMYHFVPVILCIVGVIENAISLGAIAHVRQQGDTMYHILGSLSLADMLLSAAGAAFFALQQQGMGEFSETTSCLTSLLRLFMISNVYVGAFSTVCLVIYTVLKVLKPLKNLFLLYSPRIWALLAAIWVSSLLLGFVTYIKSAVNARVPTYMCTCFTYKFDPTNLYIEIGITTGIVGVTLVIVAVCYGRVLCIAYGARRRSAMLCSNEGFENHSHNGGGGSRQAALMLHTSSSDQQVKTSICCTKGVVKGDKQKMKKEKKKKRGGPVERRLKVAVTAVLLYGVLLVFWLPYVVVNIITSAGDLTSRESAWYSYIVTILFIGNAIIDPLIYGLRLRRMRAGFASMFRRIGSVCCPGFQKEHTSMRSTLLGTPLNAAPRATVVSDYSNSTNNSPRIRRNLIKQTTC